MNERTAAMIVGSALVGYCIWRGRPQPLRNGAALKFRPVGGRSDPYPEWVRDLKGKSGVYVIRERDEDGSPVVSYVGESHTDRLYDTLTRHFQQWRRWKGFWRGQYGEGHDPGVTYQRDRVEAAVRVVEPEKAIELEKKLIQRLSPRDNIVGQVDDPPPF